MTTITARVSHTHTHTLLRPQSGVYVCLCVSVDMWACVCVGVCTFVVCVAMGAGWLAGWAGGWLAGWQDGTGCRRLSLPPLPCKQTLQSNQHLSHITRKRWYLLINYFLVIYGMFFLSITGFWKGPCVCFHFFWLDSASSRGCYTVFLIRKISND